VGDNFVLHSNLLQMICVLALLRYLCTDASGVSTLVACCLIALSKCLGDHPIDVGEAIKRIIGKTTLKMEILEAAGPLQLYAGQDAGCEVAVHAMRHVYNKDNTKAVLLVDASNAFSSLNHKVALHIKLTGESLQYGTANMEDEAVSAQGFWGDQGFFLCKRV